MRMVVAVLMIAASVFALAAVVNKGHEKITLDGGDRGLVPFPHHRHQTGLEDCDICHKLFPQETGSIVKLKSQGQLAEKQIMNKLCIQCHKAKKAAGLSSGPITCSQCHLKE